MVIMRPAISLRPAACLCPAVQPVTCRSLLPQPAAKAPWAALIRRPPLAGHFSSLQVPLPGSLSCRVLVTRISASSSPKQQAFPRRTLSADAQLTPVDKVGFHIPWRSIFRVLLLVPVFLIPAFSPGHSAYAKSEPQARRTLEVWPANHYKEEAPVVSTSNTDSHTTYRGGFEGDTLHGFEGDVQHHVPTRHHAPPPHISPQPANGFEGDVLQHHTSPAGQAQHSVSDSSTTRVAVFVTCGVALLLWLRMAQRKEHAVNERSEAGWKEPYDPQDFSPGSQPATAAAPVTAAGRPLPVQERQAKAQQDIAAAKAREAAFAGQGARQFTDINIAQPLAPDFGSDDFSGGSATDTFELRGAEPQPEDENPTGTFVLSPDGRDISSDGIKQSAYDSNASKPPSAGSRADLKPGAKREQDTGAEAELQGQSKQTTESEPSAGSRVAKDTPRSVLDTSRPSYTATAGDTEAGTAPESADTDSPATQYEADTGKPTRGRSDFMPEAEEERDAREQAQAEPQKQSRQASSLGQPAADTANEGTTAAAEGYTRAQPQSGTQKQPRQTSSLMQPADATAEGDMSAEPIEDSSSAPAYQADTSKPAFTQGRADLKPRADDEHAAREKAQAELQQKSKQTFTPDVSGYEAVRTIKTEGKPQSASPSGKPTAAATPAAPDQSGPVSKPVAGGRAPAGEHEAREKAMAKLKKESQEQQPVIAASPGQAEPIKPQAEKTKQRPPSITERQPLSEQNQTQDLARGLAGASMSAEPTKAQAKEQVSPSGRRQPSPFQAQQAASSMPTADSAAASLSPPPQPQNPFQSLVSAFQGLLGGQASPSPSATSGSARSKAATDSSSPPALGTAQQAQLTPADASAAQRMAASNQSLAAGKGQAGVRAGVPVKRYAEVTPEGNVTEFVRERGLRAPLLLLAGIAASAAQTLEPLWPVQLDSRGRKRPAPSDEEPLDWQRYQKYDVFNDLLTAAAASPAAQEERNSPFRALVNMVPQQGVPKYDFLRRMLQGSLDSYDSAPAGPRAPDGKAPRSKYDPFPSLLQSAAQADPTQSSEGPGLDPLAAALQDGKLPWKPITSKYDPFQAIFNAEDPTGSSPGPLDPLSSLAEQARQPMGLPRQAARSKLDPFEDLFNAEGPSPEASTLDPLGNLLQNARQPKAPSVESKYDPFQAIFNAEGPSSEASTLDPLGNLLQNARQPKAPSVESKYDPFQAIFNAEGPSSEASTLDPWGSLVQNVRQSLRQPKSSPLQSKYDPFQAIFNAEDPTGSSPAPLDPLSSLAEQARHPKGPPRQAARSKLDPLEALFNAEGPSSEASTLDPLGNLLQTVRQSVRQPKSPSVQSKYDPFQAIFNAEGPSSEQSPLDPLGNFLENSRQPSIDSKYDPFQAMFSAEGPSSDPSPLDPLGNLLESARQPEWQSVNSKYDPFRGMFTGEGPGADTASLDPLGNLLQAVRLPRQASVDSKYDPFQAMFRAEGPGTGAAALDPLGAVLEGRRQPWRSIKSKYDPFQAIFNARGATGEAELDPLPHVIRGIKARAHLALHRKGLGAVPSRLDKYDLVQQVLSSQAPAGPTPGFDPVGSLLKSSWVKERQAKRQQARWRPAALETAKGQAPRSSKAGPGRAPAGQHEARERAMAAQQARVKQPSTAGQQPQLSQAGESGDRQQAVADLQRRARQPAAALDTQGEGEQEGEGADRPSEWSGFIYNPYSGDLLPPEDGEDEDEQDASQPGSSDNAYGSKRSGGGGGSGKPQFISANPFRGPASIKRPTQVQALGATAVAMAALSSETTEAAPAGAPSKATYAALTVLMHLGCL